MGSNNSYWQTMASKQEFEINGRNFSTLEAFYDEISRVLLPELPIDGWGHNLDALNDILSGGFGTPEEGFILRWKHAAYSKTVLGYDETCRQLELRLLSCHPDNCNLVKKQLASARLRQGKTVFDWIVEIIEDHGPTGSQSYNSVELILD